MDRKLAHSRLRRHFANNWCDKAPNIRKQPKGFIRSKEDESWQLVCASGQTYSECRKIGPPPATGSFTENGFFCFLFPPAFCFPVAFEKNKQIPHGGEILFLPCTLRTRIRGWPANDLEHSLLADTNDTADVAAFMRNVFG